MKLEKFPLSAQVSCAIWRELSVRKKMSGTSRVVGILIFLIVSSDPDIPLGPPPSDSKEAVRKEEARMFFDLLSRAVGANGVVRLNHFPLVPGKSEQWPNWLLDNRDFARLPGEIAASLTRVDETVIDRVESSGHRTVMAHALADGEPRMLAVDRRSTADLDTLGPAVLDEYLEVAKRFKLDVAGSPLFGLDHELAEAVVRRQLLKLGISYALLLEPSFPIMRVFKRPRESWDVIDVLAVEDIFDVHDARRDRSKPNYLLVGDLTTGDSEPRGRVAEFVVEFPNDDGSRIYFITLPALPPPTKKHEQERHSAKAIEMAERGAQLLRNMPAIALRADEFHHRRSDIYRKAMWSAQWGRLI